MNKNSVSSLFSSVKEKTRGIIFTQLNRSGIDFPSFHSLIRLLGRRGIRGNSILIVESKPLKKCYQQT